MNKRESRASRRFLGLVCVGAAWAVVLSGNTAALGQTATAVVASDGTASDCFGYSVAISGDMALVGARYNSGIATYSGSAYVFQKNGSSWIQKQKLTGVDTAANDYFGSSVAIDGDIAVIGAPADDDKGINSGSAYVFGFNGSTWNFQRKLTALDGAATDLFGTAVAVSRITTIPGAYTVLVGAYNKSGSGAAYVFRFDGTTLQEQKLVALDGALGDSFGKAVAISGDVVVIGAYGNGDGVSHKGAAYVFRYHPERLPADRWVMEQKLTVSGGNLSDVFGFSVGVYGNLIVVGNHNDDDRGINFGSATVFRFNGSSWVQETKLYGSDSVTNDRFAWSVSVGNDFVVVGAPNVGSFSTTSGDGWGAVYVFRKSGSTWIQEQKLIAPDRAAFDSLGNSVGFSGNEIFAGAPLDSSLAYQAGSAYVFSLPSGGCTTNADCADDGNQCTNEVCSAGSCTHPNKPNGTACNDGNAATTGDQCSNGVCVGSVATGQCVTNADCADDGNPCTSEVCSAGTCTHPLKAAGTACTTDNNVCTTDTCSSTGVCQHTSVATGTLCTDDGNFCTNDLCSSGICTHPSKPSGTSCSDGNLCNGTETCQSGACMPGTPLVCTANQCNNPGTCNTSTGVCSAPTAKANGTTCNDGNACTQADTCQSGVCTGSNPVVCTADQCNNPGICNTATGVCSAPTAKANGTTCNDNNVSTTGDVCSAGVCVGTPILLNCDDGNPCTTDASVSGACQHTNVANGTACGSSTSTDCDNPDTCNNGTCATNNKANGTVCTDDGNLCTSDVCSAGSCTHPTKANGTACGSSATTDCDNPDTCSSGTCVPNNDPSGTLCTDDGNLCTNDLCSGGTCTHPNKANGTACGSSASTDCDNPDTCSSGTCVPNNDPSGTLCTDDGNLCTNDVCNGSGSCQHVDNSNPCTDDGNACTTDSCRAGVCQHVNICNLLPKGASCTLSSQCVSSTCKGKRGQKTCR